RQKGDKLTYEYDFGDGWVHKVELVSDPVPSDDRTIRVLGGKGACPPEDIGGPWRYSQLLEILASGDKRKLKKEFGGEILDWLPEGFDPAEFDVEDTQAELDDAFGQEAK
ncbi:MAG: plasmid pRiA4b ORF-3 family protein, partial [Bacteroidales bacterium]|nr:plasmid pRiA4b ORF-3 family protein [Bacteroidales bacterium]